MNVETVSLTVCDVSLSNFQSASRITLDMTSDSQSEVRYQLWEPIRNQGDRHVIVASNWCVYGGGLLSFSTAIVPPQIVSASSALVAFLSLFVHNPKVFVILEFCLDRWTVWNLAGSGVTIIPTSTRFLQNVNLRLIYWLVEPPWNSKCSMAVLVYWNERLVWRLKWKKNPRFVK